jgi:hypothetical protein
VTANAASLINFNWWEWLPALVLQCFSIVSATLAIATNEYDLPDATLFNAATTLRDNRNEARIAMALAEAWAFRELAIGAVNRTVSRRVMVSAFAFLSGVLYIASAVLLTTAVNALRVRTKEKSGDLIIKGFASTHTTSGPQKTPQTSSLNNGRNSTVSTSDKPTGTPKPAGGGEPCRESGKPTPAPSPK